MSQYFNEHVQQIHDEQGDEAALAILIEKFGASYVLQAVREKGSTWHDRYSRAIGTLEGFEELRVEHGTYEEAYKAAANLGGRDALHAKRQRARSDVREAWMRLLGVSKGEATRMLNLTLAECRRRLQEPE